MTGAEQHLQIGLQGIARIVNNELMLDLGEQGCIVLLSNLSGLAQAAQRQGMRLTAERLGGERLFVSIEFPDIPFPME